ncbi:CDP-diacylglycerol--glycerol-3-phosphate 3-phosphatidyltransferase [Haploplasma modicum]|uniref:CDP-diacylglycerol--glycerol-3-phosphate 3-phosphatidyltransferase n=1 Tax=Haploplasma modicum TaxID=2150 RepID=UPI00214AA844|nr:CDP-diacylglycerol--glycerol-3-phosphate 3-phosphatidyltransferase [Haploplasma modicum]MCR1809220.1 CDP-diacylglycerol--glycerol-3-phosphate 3-phosphatidyltransferase [Haploplasma modicum]
MKKMTTANKITILRLILIPIMVVFLVLEQGSPVFLGLSLFQLIAAIIFVVASFTDFVDGYIARKYNQITNFGKFLDPIADKVLVLAAMVYLIQTGRVEFWAVLIVIFREFTVTGMRILAIEKGHVVAASPYGKLKTITTMIALIFMMFNDFTLPVIYGNILWYLAILFTLISGLDYMIKNIEVFKE